MECENVVLIVADDEDFVKFIKARIENPSREVVVAHSGEECLETLKSHKPNLIIVGPGGGNVGGGSSVTDVLKHDVRYGQSKDIPILVISVA